MLKRYHTTRAQRLALFEVFSRNGFPGGYRAFRKTCSWMSFSKRENGTGTILVAWSGMLFGVEPDGYTHS